MKVTDAGNERGFNNEKDWERLVPKSFARSTRSKKNEDSKGCCNSCGRYTAFKPVKI